jgi:hypothetical protein
MVAGLRALGRALGNVYHNGYSYIWCNLAFVALSLPLVTMPAALSALFRVGHLAHTQSHEADISALWETFRANLFRALPWGLLNLLVAVINFSNIIAYASVHTVWAGVLEAIWIIVTVVWIGEVLFTWPIYYEMTTPTVWGATRNALVMVLRNPMFTLIIALFIALFSIISTVLIGSWIVLTWGVFASVGSAAVLDRLAAFRLSQVVT